MKRDTRSHTGHRPETLFRDHRAIALGISATYVVVGFETSAIAVTLPLAIAELQAGGLAGAVLSAFALTCIVGMTIAAVLGTRIPIARVQVISVVAMTVGLTATALAQSVWIVIVGRAIEGFGAGIAVVAMYMVISAAIPVALRPKMFALISSSWVIPALLGPVVAGSLTALAGWRLPFVVVAVLTTVTGVFVCTKLWGQSRPTGRRESWLAPLWALTAAAGLVAVQLAWREDRGLTMWTVLVGAVGIVMVVLSARRLLPRQTLIAGHGLPGLVATRATISSSVVVCEAWIPLLLIRERGVSVAVAGVVVSSCALGWLTGSILQARIPATRPLMRGRAMTGAACVLALTFLLVALLTTKVATPLGLIATAWMLCGICGGAAVTSVSVLVFGPYISHDYASPAAALQSGEALATAALMAATAVAFRSVTDVAGESHAFVWVLSLPVVVAVLGAWAASRAVRGIRQDLAAGTPPGASAGGL